MSNVWVTQNESEAAKLSETFSSHNTQKHYGGFDREVQKNVSSSDSFLELFAPVLVT